MAIEFNEFTDTKIIYPSPESRYAVLKKWEFAADVEGARSGLVDLFLTADALVYSEIDEDPLYGGGYPKRERVQSLENYKAFGPIHSFPETVVKELNSVILK